MDKTTKKRKIRVTMVAYLTQEEITELQRARFKIAQQSKYGRLPSISEVLRECVLYCIETEIIYEIFKQKEVEKELERREEW